MKCAVVVTIGPDEAEDCAACRATVESAWAQSRGPFSNIEIMPVEGASLAELRNRGIDRAREAGCEWIFFVAARNLVNSSAFGDFAPFHAKHDAVWGNICDNDPGTNNFVLRPGQIVRATRVEDILNCTPDLALGMDHFVRTSCADEVRFDGRMEVGEDYAYCLEVWSKFRAAKVLQIFTVERHMPSRAAGTPWRVAVDTLIEARRRAILAAVDDGRPDTDWNAQKLAAFSAPPSRMSARVITVMGHDKSEGSARRCIESAHAFGVDAEIFAAVTPATVHALAMRERIRFTDDGSEFSNADAAKSCFMSHYMLWKQCVAENVEMLVLEHDAVFVDVLPKLENVMMVNLGKPSYGQFSTPSKPGHFSLFSKARGHLPGTHAYLITPRSAARLVEFARRKGAQPADVFLNKVDFPFITEVFPWPIVADDSFSLVQTEEGCRSKHNFGDAYRALADEQYCEA